MNVIQTIEQLRDTLAKDVLREKNEYEKQVIEFRRLSDNVKTAEASIRTKVQFLTKLEAAVRVLDTADDVVSTARNTEKVRTKATTKATKSAGQSNKDAATVKPSTPKVQNRRGGSSTAEGRRAVAEGRRPPIKDAISKVMGNKTMTIGDIFDGLKEKGWLPNSNEPRQYISYLLSTSKDRFERAPNGGRGIYRVKSGATSTTAPKKTQTETTNTNGMTTDEILASAGDILGSAVFGG